MKAMTNRQRILATLRGEAVDRTPIWLLFPWHRTSYYADVRTEGSYREVVDAMVRTATVLDRRNFDIPVFGPGPAGDLAAAFPGRGLSPGAGLAGAGRFLASEDDFDRFAALPVLGGEAAGDAAVGAALEAQLPAYLAERAEFPIDLGAMMLDLGEPIGVLYHASNLAEYPIWSLTRRDEVSAFLRRLQGHFLAKYRWCLDRDLADVYFLVGSELAAPPMVSREVFREWVVPFQKELIDLVHSYGKLAVTHFHGRIRDLLPDFLELGPDGLHTIEEPPVGDCPLEKAFEVVGDRIALIGTVQYDEFRSRDPESMRSEVRRVLELARGRRFVLSPSAGPFHDELPPRMRDNYLAFLSEGDRAGRIAPYAGRIAPLTGRAAPDLGGRGPRGEER